MYTSTANGTALVFALSLHEKKKDSYEVCNHAWSFLSHFTIFMLL